MMITRDQFGPWVVRYIEESTQELERLIFRPLLETMKIHGWIRSWDLTGPPRIAVIPLHVDLRPVQAVAIALDATDRCGLSGVKVSQETDQSWIFEWTKGARRAA
jgi:hypothetical protein